MKKVILCLLLPLGCIGQSERFNYEIEGENLFWRKVFEVQSVPADSLQQIVKQLSRSGVKIIGEQKGVIFGAFEKYELNRQDPTMVALMGLYEFYAKVEVNIKPEKYRVEVSDMYYDIVTSKMQLTPMRITMSESFVKKDGTLVSNNRALKTHEKFNEKMLSVFTLKPASKKDW
ncbi:hypothetical protein [Runella sp.]|jgi:hypothetical protein|uniref:hypothetical protein n=1 Tax=Runella sp. TaxID=1960881 RepID=UPI002613F61E|nr:hypothetical protein [Runella sp.]